MKKKQRLLREELKEYESHGIRLYLNGIRSDPKSIAKACRVAERGVYMRDYTGNSMGKITRLDFDYVKMR